MERFRRSLLAYSDEELIIEIGGRLAIDALQGLRRRAEKPRRLRCRLFDLYVTELNKRARVDLDRPAKRGAGRGRFSFWNEIFRAAVALRPR